MTLIAYRLSDKRVVKRFNNSYDAEYFLREQRYKKKTNFTGFFSPQKSLNEMDLAIASIHDVITVKRRGTEYVTKRGSEIYALPPASKGGILQKISNIWRYIKKWRKKKVLRSV